MEKLKIVINNSQFEEIDLTKNISFKTSQDIPYYASVTDDNDKSEIAFDYMFNDEPKETKDKDGNTTVVYGKRSGKIYQYKFSKDIDVAKLIEINKSLKRIMLDENYVSKRYEKNIKNLVQLLSDIIRLLNIENQKNEVSDDSELAFENK